MRISASRVVVASLLGLIGASAVHASCSTTDRSEQVALVLCSANTDQAALKAAGMAACKDKKVCNAWIWEDASKLPPKAPAIDKDLPKSAAGAARAVWIHDSQHLMELRKAR
ncbi:MULTISPECIES: hypothetical protein [unclassified Roseateles]|uniref:hypothetical protein n=1 Tax=unclassified Roseateles TaxID=2626991 RepID=UPI0012E39C37|nr:MULTISPECIES: hypothetical protein [unclassified Roseateles]